MKEQIKISNFTGNKILLEVGYTKEEEPDFILELEDKKVTLVDKELFVSGCYDLILLTKTKDNKVGVKGK